MFTTQSERTPDFMETETGFNPLVFELTGVCCRGWGGYSWPRESVQAFWKEQLHISQQTAQEEEQEEVLSLHQTVRSRLDGHRPTTWNDVTAVMLPSAGRSAAILGASHPPTACSKPTQG
ncbi:hypothetical protein OJAV_G00168240 [Oryzias javanicus]|uniref:Uncharacterized protein n=1 Tax=Oryzias javanicus TaxID=123683 RepID=A0A3S2M6U8_ORYJA|nr:hypothetical protein OJAV_G00168240 [Oryzias javanicus]